MRKAKLRWFGYLKRCVDVVREVGYRGYEERGRPKKYRTEVIRHDMTQLHMTTNMTLNSTISRTHIRVEG